MYVLFFCFIKLISSVHSFDPGTVIEVGHIPIDTSALVNKLIAGKSNQTGSFIRSKADQGCLEAGHRNNPVPQGEIYTPWIYKGCPNNPWVKWHWDGDLLKVGTPPDFDAQEACLDCWKNSPYCDLKVFKCNGGPSQQFFIRIHPNQVDRKNHKLYFSIHSKSHPSKCLSWYLREIDWHPAQRKTNRWNKEKVARKIYQLQECRGLDHQSFVISHEKMEDYENVKKGIFKILDTSY